MVKSILLLRHAEPVIEEGFSKDFFPDYELSLSQEGVLSTKDLGKKMSQSGVNFCILSSPRVRAIETSQLLAKALRIRTPVEIIDNIRPRSYGDWGRTRKSVHISPVNPHILDSRDFTPPNGESMEQVNRRVRGALTQIIGAPQALSQLSIVITHAKVLSCIKTIAGIEGWTGNRDLQQRRPRYLEGFLLETSLSDQSHSIRIQPFIDADTLVNLGIKRNVTL